MNSKILFRPGPLQQQPQRRANQQQQQSSGSGEFQPRRSMQPGQDSVSGPGQRVGTASAQSM
jgi:hypothetical protein